jgi:hypothetical protein
MLARTRASCGEDASGTNLGQEIVVVRAYPVREAFVCIADFGEQNGDLRFPSHSAGPTIEDGNHHVVEKMAAETRSALGQASVGSGASRSESFISDQGNPWCAERRKATSRP